MRLTAAVWHVACAEQRVVAMDRDARCWYVWSFGLGVDVPALRLVDAATQRWASECALRRATNLDTWRGATPLPRALPPSHARNLDVADCTTRAHAAAFAPSIDWLRSQLELGAGAPWRIRFGQTDAHVCLSATTGAALELNAVVDAFPTVTRSGRAALAGWIEAGELRLISVRDHTEERIWNTASVRRRELPLMTLLAHAWN